MRDILNTLDDILAEGSNLMASELNKDLNRFNTFIQFIKTGQPFYTTTGQEVILDPREADRLVKLKQANDFRGAIQVLGRDGITKYPISSFLKTKDFGGHAAKPGSQEVGKESAGYKPKQIGITDQNIPATGLLKVIASNPKLKSTPGGQAVIAVAKQIAAGKPAVLPPEIAADKNLGPAIRDYAGEYLGVLALINNQTNFPNRDEFLKWLGGDLQSLVLKFPSDETNPLADSFAEITNPTTSHQINISSKGKGGGAAPALSKLKVPEHLSKKKKYANALKFIDITKNSSTAVQPFEAMNFLNSLAPNLLPAKFRPFVPFSDAVVQAANQSRINGTPLPKLAPMWSDIKFKKASTDGGKLMFAIKNAVVEMINAGAIPEMQAVILEILDYNFIQQYSDLQKNQFVFRTQWPAKLNGTITMSHKSSAVEPTSGGFSFKLGPAEVATESMADQPQAEPPKKYGTPRTLGRPRQP